MGKIFCLMGKSASGKDTIYRKLLTQEDPGLKRVIPYTTRPIRSGETDGDTYFFRTLREAARMEQEGKVIEIRDYFGAESVKPLYVWVEDGERLARALERERSQEHPKYAELCRRFLADEEDFSPEKLQEAGVTRWFENRSLDQVLGELTAYIREELGKPGQKQGEAG